MPVCLLRCLDERDSSHTRHAPAYCHTSFDLGPLWQKVNSAWASIAGSPGAKLIGDKDAVDECRRSFSVKWRLACNHCCEREGKSGGWGEEAVRREGDTTGASRVDPEPTAATGVTTATGRARCSADQRPAPAASSRNIIRERHERRARNVDSYWYAEAESEGEDQLRQQHVICTEFGKGKSKQADTSTSSGFGVAPAAVGAAVGPEGRAPLQKRQAAREGERTCEKACGRGGGGQRRECVSETGGGTFLT